MPIYEYRNCITGETVELWRHVADRDKVPAHLTRIPSRPATRIAGVMAADHPENGDASARRGLKELEEKLGGRELARQMNMDLNSVKKTWEE